MSLITLGHINKNLIPILLGCFFALLGSIIFSFDDILLYNHVIILNIIASFAKALSIVPLLVFNKRTKDNKDEASNKSNKIKFLYTNKTEGYAHCKYAYFLLLGSIFFTQAVFASYSMRIKINSWIFRIVFICLFSYWISKIKLYKHHYFSMSIILIIGIVMDISFQNYQNDIENNALSLLFKFGEEIFYSLYLVLNRYLMEKKFCSVYELCFFNGLINMILFIIFGVIDYYYLQLDDIMEYFNNFKYIDIVIIIVLIIEQLGLNISNLFTIKNNTTCHTFIIFVFGKMANYFSNFDNYSIYTIIIIICLCFILFMSLIFNEIIEINICELQHNTRKNISNRAENSDIYSTYSVNEITDEEIYDEFDD